MIVAVTFPTIKQCYVVRGWATPPNSDGYSQFDIDGIKEISDRTFVIEQGSEEMQISADLPRIVYKSARLPRDLPEQLIDVVECPHCDGSHEQLSAQPLRTLLPGFPPQAEAYCPTTAKKIFVYMRIELEDDETTQ